MIVEVVVSVAGLIVIVYGAIIHDLYAKITLKQDISLCQEIKRGIDADLARGDKRFDELLDELKQLARCLNELSKNLALTAQRLQAIEDRLPLLERREE